MYSLYAFRLWYCRLDYRMEWDKALREYLKKLDSTKPLIYCGDLNVAHNPIGMYLVYWND